MKKSMQVIAIAAFLGCFAILVIAAGGKASSEEGCSEEWQDAEKRAGDKAEEKEANGKPAVAAAQRDGRSDELIFPAQFFHKYL